MIEPRADLFEDMRSRRLLVALSGGADSVALLVLLARCAEQLSISLQCAHVEHGLRGEESLADAAFCERLCADLNVNIHIVSVNVPAECAKTGSGVETVARRLRHEALENIRNKISADRIVLAHHRNDQAETVLMHLLRGSGIKGACGMPRDDGRLYRPLLAYSRRELEDFLLREGLTWRTDSTNFIADTPRNALRANIFPELEKLYPNAQDALARFGECAQVENRFMEKLAEQFLRTHLERGVYGLRIVHPESADEAILRRAMAMVFPETLDYEKTIRLCNLANHQRGRCDISGAYCAEKTPDALYILDRREGISHSARISLNGETPFLPLGCLKAQSAPAVASSDPFCQVLCKNALEGAVIRTRRNGDRIRPLGCGEKLLSDYLTDKKVDRPLRDFLPLIARENQILWVIGYGISESAKLKSQSDCAVALQWNPLF